MAWGWSFVAVQAERTISLSQPNDLGGSLTAMNAVYGQSTLL